MNKRMKVMVGMVVVAVATVFTNKVSSTEEKMSEVMLANIEALATPEYNTPSICHGVGCATCPFTGVKVKYVIEPYNLK